MIKPYHSGRFKALGLHTKYDEELVVTSAKDVIRGLHFQGHPLPQIKVISCAKGKILDVVVDIRKGSPTYAKWDSFILDSENSYVLYVPEGLAHGYAVFEENTIVCYRMSNIFSAELEGGIRWDSVGVEWGIESPVISERDRNLIPLCDIDSKFIY
ncbi:dTDP-4-dehydrorhamnose 3,5-epimerase [Desulfocucumis palustris]|uniref:dTDP-4-dehydrorhamnose 3,5-epimerase n=1 Tax=Desulfocucumis palustris TaxID=1898651 RepID=A0A2L2XB69_9FIRM|nr:dTDP-4-dehydrorhamnose 3,5-epimerase [Desulfocucumis palustris]